MKVLIKGGLGNQLFQFCYIHFLFYADQKKVEIIKDPNSRVDRPFLIEKLSESCTHIENGMRNKKDFLYFLRIRTAKLRLIRGIIYRYQELKTVAEPQEYSFLSKIPKYKKNSIFVGYYQNWRYVESSWAIVGPEILTVLREQVLNEFPLQDYLVVHVRRGDWTLQSDQVGILKNPYYDKAIEIVLSTLNLSTIPIYVISDEPDEAKQLFKDNSGVIIIGPEELDEWGCLGLMSRAKAVITANSTLSWWGGYLSYKNGGIMVIPNPWFAEWGERVGSAFANPGVLQVDSRYRQ